MAKPELEFHDVSAVPWEPAAPGVPGLTQKILARESGPGVVTRLLRWEPGTDTSPAGAQIHDFWEEVYILEGSIVDLGLGKTFTRGMYACRPPGMRHGPWLSKDGCTTFEVRYSR
ncbi:MAG TPA: cupin domain-containing protein [Planctomycetota bacterium]|nr:cupin domain-containing protein [Planctomycetota bacterium]